MNLIMGAGIVGYIANVFMDPMSNEFGWTRTQFMLGFTISQFAMAFTGLFVGRLVDQYGPRRFMIAGTILIFVSLLCTALVTELYQWLIIRGIFQGIALVLAGSMIVTVTISKWFVKYRGRAIGLIALGLSFAGIIIPNLMTFIVDTYGWRFGWNFLAFLALLCILPCAFIMRKSPEDYGLLPDGVDNLETKKNDLLEKYDYEKSLTRSEVIKLPSFWIILFSYNLVGVAVLTIATLTIPFMTDYLFSRTQSAQFIAVLAIPGVFTRPFWGLFAEKILIKYLACIAFFFVGAGLLVIVYGADNSSLFYCNIGYFITGIGLAGTQPVKEILWPIYFGRKNLGSIRGFIMPFELIFHGSGPLIATWYAESVGTYLETFTCLAFFALFASVLIFIAKEPQQRKFAEIFIGKKKIENS
ncbi:MAG: MFS transporter [Dehalococcoidia bacterium]